MFWRTCMLAIACSFAICFAAAQEKSSDQDGQYYLDEAVKLKVKANSIGDLSRVIQLCEKALEEGLDENSAEFARSLLAGTLVQRALQLTKGVPGGQLPGALRPELRRLAIADLERGLKLQPNQPEGWLSLAELYLLEGQELKKVRKAVAEAVLRSKDDPQLYVRALMLQARLSEQPEEKLTALNKILELDPENSSALRLRAALLAEEKQYDKALQDVDKLLSLVPEDARAWHLKGLILIEQKRYKEALDCFEKARAIEPGLETLVEEARVYGLLSQYDRGIELLTQALTAAGDNPAILVLRASMYAELKKWEEALADLDQALRVDPNFAPAMRVRVSVLIELDRLDEAILQLERLRKLHPDDLDLLLQLGILYSATERPRHAIEVLSQVLEKNPDEPRALTFRANAYLAVGDHARAIDDFEKAVVSNANDPVLLNNFAWVLATSPDDDLRDGKRAIELATKACELTDYKEAYILSTLAAAYAETGDFDSAVKWAKKALELGKPDEIDHLRKELESYKNGKPWRERQSVQDKPLELPDRETTENKKAPAASEKQPTP